MVFKDKEVEVILLGDAESIFLELKDNLKNKESKIIFLSIARALEKIEHNPHAGIQIPKKLIPKVYVEKYSVTNLWKMNLAHFWRIIYWVDGSKVKIVSFVVDIVNHKIYDKKFKY